MLEACKRDSLPVYYQLAGVGSPDADHEHDLHVHILLEQTAALLLRGSGERDHIGTLEHLLQIGPIGESCCPNHVAEVWTLGVDDVILPVRLEEATVSFEVAVIGGDAVGAIEYGEEIGQQVDQHSTGKPPARGAARGPSATGAPHCGRVGRGMIAAAGGRNKRDIRYTAVGGRTSSRTAPRTPSRDAREIGTKISFGIGEEERGTKSLGDTES